MKAGNHLGVDLIDAGLGRSPEKKTPFVRLTFRNQEGESIDYHLWLSIDSKERSIQTLIQLGYQGKKISSIANDDIPFEKKFSEPSDRIDLVVEEEVYTNSNGEDKVVTNVKWVNIGSRGGMQEFSFEEAKGFFDSEIFDGLLKDQKRLVGNNPKPKPKAKPRTETESKPNNYDDNFDDADDSDDLPF